MINVIIADDHPLVRQGIKKVLEDEIDIKLTAEASNGNELMGLLRDHHVDMAILDITMPGKSGLTLLKEINRRYPDLPVLILSIHPADRFAVRALRAGARGYLSKSSISKELINAVRKIAIQKRRYITPEVAEQLARQIDYSQTGNEPLHEILSDREFEVLCKIASGCDINTIADDLSISPHTVHTYRTRIKDKLELSSNVEMTRYALENELIS